MPRRAARASSRAALALGLALSTAASAAPSRGAPEAASASRDVAWSFNAGMPLSAPPSVAPDGSVLVVTVEGYLHALRAEGGYRYSYTLRGRAVGSPVATAEGLTVISVEPNRLVALDPDGGLAWVTTVVGGVATAPVVDDRGRIWVGTGGRTLLGFSSRGGVSAFARVGPAPLAGPVALPGGEVALASADGSLRIAGGPRAGGTAPSQDAIRRLFLGEGSLLALGDAGLVRFDVSPLGERWRRLGVERVLCTSPGLVVLEHGAVRYLTLRGEPGPLVAFPAPRDAPTACLPDGGLLVAEAPRAVLRLDASGAATRRTVPDGDVLSLQPLPPFTALVAYRGGRVVALR